MKKRNYFFAFAASIIFLSLVTGYLLYGQGIILNAPKPSNIVSPVTPIGPPVNISTDHCTTPLRISQEVPLGGTGLSKRTMAYVPSIPLSDRIKFYDGGADMKFGNLDDLGFRQPSSLIFMSDHISYLKMDGENIVFEKATRAGTGHVYELFIYSIGPDGIANTPDDSGPTLIYSGPSQNHLILNLNIDNNLVSFIVYDGLNYASYYCHADSPSGSCWTSTPQLYKWSSTITDYFATKSGQDLYHFYVEYDLIYYEFIINQQRTQGRWTNTNNVFNVKEGLEDIKYPLVLTSEDDFINRSGVLNLGLVFSNTLTFPIAQINYSSLGHFWEATVSKRSVRSSGGTDYWLIFLQSNWVGAGTSPVIISKFPHDGRTIKILPSFGSYYGVEDRVDGNNLVMIGNDPGIYVSQCYFD